MSLPSFVPGFCQLLVERPSGLVVVKTVWREKYESNLFVFHLPEFMLEEELKELFGKYGDITQARVEKHPDGRSRGYGFVRFDHPDSALAAMHALDRFPITCASGVVKRLHVSFKGAPRRRDKVCTCQVHGPSKHL
eukprot:gnl/Hemi2/7801_TR2698_c0_g1_i1.p2 gnl/Hemi2/7801_TR2698_c0_g1~~gnl/Hemi2/7801_TR2698_c0_g1_i1.p2  ORF type:complete len:136 (-),score=30.72 gnl/Hemi2/7801_TR2698_c0_g1_i1:31-438(-)